MDEGDGLDFVGDCVEEVHHCFELGEISAVAVDEEHDVAWVELDGFGDSGFERVGGDVDADDALNGEYDVGLALTGGAVPGFNYILGDAAKHGVIGVGRIENDVLGVFGDDIAVICVAALQGDLVGGGCAGDE